VLPALPPAATDAHDLVRSICVFLYAHAPERIRARAVLCHVYNHALNKRFYRARDLLLTSHLQESIQHADITTQVLFNRAMVQIGVCAFRNGLIKECHQALSDIMAALKSKDLLAQGTQLYKYGQQTSDLEKKERLRMLPFHTHINLELLECVQLITSMLLEIPAMAVDSYDVGRRKVASKHFRRLYEFHERQMFHGPPESFRDHILQGAKALSMGDWQKCAELVTSIKQWSLLPDVEELKEMLVARIKEEGLRTYLLAFGSQYENVDLNQLADQFELARAKVHSIAGKMIMNEELHASIDQPTGVLQLYRVAPTRLQQLALHYCDRANVLVESNERAFEFKFQTQQYAQRDGGDRHHRGGDRGGDRGGQRQHRGGYQGGRGGRGGRGGYQQRRQYGNAGNAAATTANA
jgi:translation initiation factor 3 subunit C